jgi:hypothetical protein
MRLVAGFTPFVRFLQKDKKRNMMLHGKEKVRFEVLTAVSTNMVVFWVVATTQMTAIFGKRKFCFTELQKLYLLAKNRRKPL